MRFVVGLLVTFLFGVGAFPVAATTVALINGSFEEGSGQGSNGSELSTLGQSGGGSWDIFASLPGWSTLEGDGIEVQTNGTLGSISAHSGTRYVELDSNGNGRIAQEVSLAPGRYTLSFWYTPRQRNPETNGVQYQVVGEGNTVLEGTITGPTAGQSVGTWIEVVAPFTTEVFGTYSIQLASIGTSDSYGGLIDTVSLFGTPAAEQQTRAPLVVTPVPPSGLALGAGVGLLLAWSRRRHLVKAR